MVLGKVLFLENFKAEWPSSLSPSNRGFANVSASPLSRKAAAGLPSKPIGRGGRSREARGRTLVPITSWIQNSARLVRNVAFLRTIMFHSPLLVLEGETAWNSRVLTNYWRVVLANSRSTVPEDILCMSSNLTVPVLSWFADTFHQIPGTSSREDVRFSVARV